MLHSACAWRVSKGIKNIMGQNGLPYSLIVKTDTASFTQIQVARDRCRCRSGGGNAEMRKKILKKKEKVRKPEVLGLGLEYLRRREPRERRKASGKARPISISVPSPTWIYRRARRRGRSIQRGRTYAPSPEKLSAGRAEARKLGNIKLPRSLCALFVGATLWPLLSPVRLRCFISLHTLTYIPAIALRGTGQSRSASPSLYIRLS